MRKVGTFVAAALGMALSSQALPAVAQVGAPVRSDTQGFMLGAALNGTALRIDFEDLEGEIESGGGLSLMAGYGFSPAVLGFARLGGAVIQSTDEGDEYNYGFFDLGARFSFANATRALVPYLEAAVTGQAAVVDLGGDDLSFTGWGGTLGGGLKYFFSPAFALDTGLRFTVGQFTSVEFRGAQEDVDDVSTMTTRIDIGLAWFP